METIGNLTANKIKQRKYPEGNKRPVGFALRDIET
jgi:hypothetical protein